MLSASNILITFDPQTNVSKMQHVLSSDNQTLEAAKQLMTVKQLLEIQQLMTMKKLLSLVMEELMTTGFVSVLTMKQLMT